MKIKNDVQSRSILLRQAAIEKKPAAEVGKKVGDVLKKIADAFQKGPTTHSEYKATLRGMDDKALATEKRRLEALVRDASTGPVKDDAAVTRAKAQLAEVAEELKARDGFATSKNPEYARETHQMSGADLSKEAAKQRERLQEATTGLDTDPAKAADAKQKLEILQKEQFGRLVDAFQGKLPEDPPTKKMGFLEKALYNLKANSMSETDLAAEKKKLESTVRDATTGAHKDPVAAANAQEKLQVLAKIEEARNKTVGGYKDGLRHMSDDKLAAEKAKWESVVKDASTGASRDPGAVQAAQAKLTAINEELKAREGIAASKDPKYAQAAHTMDDKALRAERDKQMERFFEATTGAARDPQVAEDAREKLGVLMREQLTRLLDDVRGNLPVDGPTKPISDRSLKSFRDALRDDSPAQLDAKKARLERQVSDAQSGAHTDPVQVENAQKQLKQIEAELADRKRIQAGPQPEYGMQAHGMSKKALATEVKKQEERLREATTGYDQDPKVAADAREKLDILKREQADRVFDALKNNPIFRPVIA